MSVVCVTKHDLDGPNNGVYLLLILPGATGITEPFRSRQHLCTAFHLSNPMTNLSFRTLEYPQATLLVSWSLLEVFSVYRRIVPAAQWHRIGSGKLELRWTSISGIVYGLTRPLRRWTMRSEVVKVGGTRRVLELSRGNEPKVRRCDVP